MALSDIISITISVQASAVSRAGFGVPLICSYHTHFAGRVATYTSLAELVTAGFGTGDATYLAANALLATLMFPSFAMPVEARELKGLL